MKIHLYKHNQLTARCGYSPETVVHFLFDDDGVATDNWDLHVRGNCVEFKQWETTPWQAQCSKCSRSLTTRVHATVEQITAVEVALHRLSRVWEPALTAAKAGR